MNRHSFLIFASALLILVPSLVWAGQITLTTYYPAPTGNYDLVTANNVGIGTTGPSSKLEVQAGQIRVLDVPWNDSFQAPRMAGWIRNQGPGLLVDVDSDYAFFGLKHEGPANSNRNDVVIGWGDDGRENGAVQAGDSVRFVHFTAGAEYERLRIDPAGNVGIGSTNPNSGSFGRELHISGDDSALVLNSTNATGREFAIASSRSGGQALLRFYDLTAQADRMVINSSGNVGIGLADPRGLIHTYTPSVRNFLLVDSDRAGDN
ncbi:MAG: hypothetical protein HY591_02675, partial [Candidatus Omnitrophica bacterium]|nr:hypothetical protein [Candidatus Omnitrophota bacterium]